MKQSTDEWHPPRRLKVFAFDPTTAKSFSTHRVRHVTISLPWEMDPDVKLGPIGEYLEVIDYDPASRSFYPPVDLDDPRILSNGGLDPSEENPQFHQQMVYAVAMNTIATFEKALGRKVLWSEDSQKTRDGWKTDFVRRLRVYPHALREANAYYSPQKKSLLFGYFEAPERSETIVPGTMVFTCLSHDIVVHETVHAILDGMHPSFAEASHPDMRAIHEAFADIVAIFQLFSFPDVLVEQIARTRGDLESQSELAQLAQEFGKALGRSGALRDALGSVDPETETWKMKEPDRTLLRKVMSPHARGSILVAAVFRAFLNVYQNQTEDLFRIASGGSGILREGSLDPDLANRLSEEAATVARRILRICIRGLDYVPPVAVSFGDYLRAMITADHDLFPEDSDRYRSAILEAFSAWGIVPEGIPVVSMNTLIWPTLSQAIADLKSLKALKGEDVSIERIRGGLGAIITRPRNIFDELSRDNERYEKDRGRKFIEEVRRDHERLRDQINSQITKVDELRQSAQDEAAGAPLKLVSDEDAAEVAGLVLGQAPSREAEHDLRQYYARMIWMLTTANTTPELARVLGITLSGDAPASVRRSRITGLPSLHVLPVRRALRVGDRHRLQDEYVIELVQTRFGYMNPKEQERVDREGLTELEEKAKRFDFRYQAGCTVLVDASTFNIRRLIRTPYPVQDDRGLNQLRDFLNDARQGLRNAFNDGDPGESTSAFADLHRNPNRVEEDW